VNTPQRDFRNATLLRARRLQLLLLLLISCLTFAAAEEAQAQIRVPGTSGRRWVDTGIDLAPGTLVRLQASGRVDVGAGWGVHGPEGTTRFANVAGYPADTRLRYGLVARVTDSRTNYDDDLRNDYAYGETREFCVQTAGHLWLTVNDNHPVDNTGEFLVEVTRGTCSRAPTSTPAPLRGRFRVRLNGFTVNRQTWDNLTNIDGWADEIYVSYNINTVDVSGRWDPALMRTINWASRTATFGDNGGGRTGVVRAGDGSSSGGLVTGNSFPRVAPWNGGARETGPAIFEADLVQGRTGGVIIPALFEADGNRNLIDTYNSTIFRLRPNIETSLISLISGPALRSTSQFIPNGGAVGLGNLASSLSHGATIIGEAVDRPIGMARAEAFGLPGGGPLRDNYTFIPKALVLTYESADIISRSDIFRRGRGIIEIRYRDDERLQGDYTLYFQVERIR
jgi:hypothetical protein